MAKKKQIKQKGGFEGISYDAGGTSGWPWTLAEDIIGTIIYTINGVVNAVGVVDDLINLPSDMGTAFAAKNAPNPDSIDINGF